MAEEEEDIISTLPNVILCHILSFLKTKESIATTILSKRWNNLWRSVPSLNLGLTQLENQNAYDSFLHFVNTFLLSLDPALPINNFILYCFSNYYANLSPQSPMESITKWINIAVQRGVQYIDLCVETAAVNPCNLPISILTCTTLVVLKIDGFIVENGFTPVTLPSLKTLHLRDISFPQHRDFMLFLAGCPILEDLFTYKVLFDSVVSLTCDEWKSFSLTNLTTANIDGRRGHYRHHINFPLQLVHNVSSLRLEIGQEDYIDDFIPTFHNMTQLDFVCSSLNNNRKLVVNVLKHCPKLQKLRLKEAELREEDEFGPGMDDNENWVDPDFVPQCLSLHLRTCSFKSCFGLHGTELMLAKYILKNAKVLQTMKVKNTGETKIEQQLSSCPRASAICKLKVHYVPEFGYDVKDNEVEADDGDYVEEDEFEDDF